MTYFHPRDFEPDQPILPGLGPVRRFKSYYGLRGAERKLRAIIGEFPFQSGSAAEKEIDWTKVPVVRIDDSPAVGAAAQRLRMKKRSPTSNGGGVSR